MQWFRSTSSFLKTLVALVSGIFMLESNEGEAPALCACHTTGGIFEVMDHHW